MLALMNTNRMLPAIAPIGLDYVARAVRQQGFDVELLDLGLAAAEESEASPSHDNQRHAAAEPGATVSLTVGGGAQRALTDYFAHRQPELVGLTFRNVDDCFWPSGVSFLPELQELISAVREVTDAPLVLGGVGFSIFAERIVELTGADFGIHGDGEQALGQLLCELRGQRRLERVGGLIWREDGQLRANPPAWPPTPGASSSRDAVDNASYFRLGGQIGLETKRGCPRRCIYCAEPLAKGRTHRLRDPAEVADEAQALLTQGIDVLHLCDSEFNLPREHAQQVCAELIRRRLGERLRWYAYLSITPFDAALAGAMRQAGCVGINFTSDSVDPAMLTTYRQPHTKDDLAQAVRLCRDQGIKVMLDLLLGGPGETAQSLADTIAFCKQVDPDCAGAALGVRVYPGTEMATIVAGEGPLETNPSLRRHYHGPVDLLHPTFYISSTLGPQPAQLIRDLIGDDERFFPPEPDAIEEGTDTPAPSAGDHNYNANRALIDAIAGGARGAYWDILHQLRAGSHS